MDIQRKTAAMDAHTLASTAEVLMIHFAAAFNGEFHPVAFRGGDRSVRGESAERGNYIQTPIAEN